MIRALLIEDEPLAQEYLRRLLHETEKIEVVASAISADEGLALFAQLHPDVVFIDLRLAGSDGFALAQQLRRFSPQLAIVFVTGYSDKAVAAFELAAVDYLLKPLHSDRVRQTVLRLEERLRNYHLPETFTIANLRPDEERLVVKNIATDTIKLLSKMDIFAAVHRDRKTFIYTQQEQYPTYYSLLNLEHWLKGMPFLRISRSAIINLEAIEKIIHYGDRLYQVHLCDQNHTIIEASRSGAVLLASHLKNHRLPSSSIQSIKTAVRANLCKEKNPSS
ncbi:two component transcriptional regulator, LytTR family [Chthonomonas calidirosea]|uniref:Two component transcriptional regulator, LytTR family n=1 Tax=Chthonomonas calidirosea (strain DSM 23976 / ICMP 18418 / T49) TaxID=1303518 RepID=S0EWP5_CHTCT|nr:LytTR family DNA-binding domain-containing protein [Chthonomonas calidirosea]CCW36333.1 two component transcriptional regulator, LytTR family [Chthonomonas calidirosea T49]CEK17644.1 two component transcriptional regulator, LytTR family [Chthonomonas calidirosea]